MGLEKHHHPLGGGRNAKMKENKKDGSLMAMEGILKHFHERAWDPWTLNKLKFNPETARWRLLEDTNVIGVVKRYFDNLCLAYGWPVECSDVLWNRIIKSMVNADTGFACAWDSILIAVQTGHFDRVTTHTLGSPIPCYRCPISGEIAQCKHQESTLDLLYHVTSMVPWEREDLQRFRSIVEKIQGAWKSKS